MRLPASALLFLLAVAGRGQQDEASRTALLSRVLGTMRQANARMPDYTCTENITRSIGDGTPLRVRTLERLRLQVADRKSTRLNSSHRCISYAVFCLKKK